MFAVATAAATFLALAIIGSLISTNVRELAKAWRLDTVLLRFADRVAAHPHISRLVKAMIAGWEPVRARWGLWLGFGFSAGVALTLWLQPSPPSALAWTRPLVVIGKCVPAEFQNAWHDEVTKAAGFQSVLSSLHNQLLAGVIVARGQHMHVNYVTHGVRADPIRTIDDMATEIRPGEWQGMVPIGQDFSVANPTDGQGTGYVHLEMAIAKPCR